MHVVIINGSPRVEKYSNTEKIIDAFADGLRRCLGNGNGKLWYKGHLVPIVGNICMDICMVDVTGLDAHEGDPIEIFGKNLPITQVAEWMNTIPYEVLTGISRRVKRTYQYE